MTFFINCLLVVLAFGLLIFIHELGHFIFARLFSVGVRTFSIGMGPRLFSVVRGKTRYQIAAIPFGGYVDIVGERPGAEVTAPFTEADNFANRPAWQRFIIFIAGSAFNILLAWIICWGLVYTNGKYEIDPVIGTIKEDSPAAQAQLCIDDRITAINDKPIASWKDIPLLVQKNGEAPLKLTFERDGKTKTLSIAPTKMQIRLATGEEASIWALGIQPKADRHITFSFFGSAIEGAKDTARMMTLIYDGIASMFAREVPLDQVAGPVGITKSIYAYAKLGLSELLFFTALISVNLGMLNLLPIPVLDGGHALFLIVEMITRRPVRYEIQQRAMFIGVMLLAGLMLFATFNDVLRMTR